MSPQRVKREKVAASSGDVMEEQIAKLRKLFPEVVVEGKIDFAKLRATLGAAAESGPGRFSFTWAGKDDALAVLQTPSRGTLIPCPEQSIDFDATGNVFIEGDNLEVLKLLFKPYFGRIKLIYIDPPYNTGQDFVYPDNYADPLATYLQLSGQADAEGNLLTSNPETSGRYHSAWLSMMYPRLFLARQLLREDGAIFVSIDDHEVHHLRMLMNEVFGEENFIGVIVWKGATDNNPTRIATEHEYFVCYAKDQDAPPTEWKNKSHDAKQAMLQEYRTLHSKNGGDPELIQVEFRRFIKQHKESLQPLTHYDRIDTKGPYTGSRKVHNPKPGGYKYSVFHPVTKKVCVPPVNGYRYPEETMNELLQQGRILFGEDETQIIQIKEYLSEFEGKLSSVIHLDSRVGSNELNDHFPGERKLFTNPKPTLLLKELFGFCLEPHDLLLDFFSGSCSSADAVLQMNRHDGGNRKFIMIQLPEPTGNKDYRTIAEIGKERIRRVVAKLRKEAGSKLDFSDGKSSEDLGFKVFHLAPPHIRQWAADADRDPDAYSQKLALFDEPLVSGWTAANVLWEIALREGYSLNARFETTQLANGNTLHIVRDADSGQHFFVCLDDEVRVDLSQHCELTADRLLVCRDRALDDTAAANLALQCRLKTI